MNKEQLQELLSEAFTSGYIKALEDIKKSLVAANIPYVPMTVEQIDSMIKQVKKTK